MGLNEAGVIVCGPGRVTAGLLERRGGSWRMERSSTAAVDSPLGSDGWARDAARLAGEAGLGRRVRLVVPAGFYVVQEVAAPLDGDAPAAEAFCAEVERQAPGVRAGRIVAEHVVVERTGGSCRAVALGVEEARLEGLLGALAGAGLEVSSVVPDVACLAAFGSAALHSAPGGAAEALEFVAGAGDEHLLLAWFEGGRLGGMRAARVSDRSPGALARRAAREMELVRQSRPEPPERLRVLVVGGGGLEAGLGELGLDASAAPPPAGGGGGGGGASSGLDAALLLGALETAGLTGGREIDLRGGALGRRARPGRLPLVSAIAAAALVVLLAVSGARRELGRVRAEREVDGIRRAELDVYARCFPGGRPFEAFTFAENVRRELDALSGGAAGGDARPGVASALDLVSEIGRSLPDEASYTVTRVYVTQEGASLWGETAELADVDRLEGALNRSAALSATAAERKLAEDGGRRRVVFEIRIRRKG